MTEPIDAIRSIRTEADPFERVLSGLTCEIGRVERLNDLDPDQLDRLKMGTIRLANATRKHGNE